MSRQFGAIPTPDGTRFSVWSGAAERVWVSLFDEKGGETDRVELTRGADDVFAAEIAGFGPGARYGLRADGPNDPERGLWFDPDKLLVDPYALALDRPFAYDARLAVGRGESGDTAPLMPKALVQAPLPLIPLAPPLFRPGGLIYELNVRGFTKLHPDVPEHLRGTIAALAHPAVIAHLKALHVDAIELMPIAAWMDERHLPPLGLTNAWGYNPVSFAALDPRIAPGGWAELRDTVAVLHAAGIGVILDVVFNHTAESDALGPTLSLRGLDASAYYRHDADGRLANDTGTGNTLACDHPAVRRLVLDTLRTFVLHAGVDGFRFDLAPVLGRTAEGFEADAPLLREMAEDEVISSRVLIAEPWDIGPGGYQLGAFRPPLLEWNDRFRDDVRRFWRGDEGMVGALATRLAGSADVFGDTGTRTINFIAAHDGMTLVDLASYAEKHNLANGEDNRDGHDDNISWNHGVEGPSDESALAERRAADIRAMLATLFSSRGAIMLTAGDEFGRTQRGNNNAYAQDNEITWLDWAGRDPALEAFACEMAALRRRHEVLGDIGFLPEADVDWLREDAEPMTVADWEDPTRRLLTMILGDLAIVFNGTANRVTVRLPEPTRWLAAASAEAAGEGGRFEVAPRSVTVLERI